MDQLTPEPDFPDSFRQGMIFAHRGRFDQASRCFEEALDQKRNSGSPYEIMVILGNLGNTYAVQEKLAEARLCYEEVLSLQKKASDVRTIGQTLVNLGNLSREMKQLDRAEAYYLEAADSLNNVGDEHSLGLLNSNFGLLAYDRGDFQKAVNFFENAIELHKKTGHEEGLAASWYELGRAHLLLLDGEKAETCFNYSSMHFHNLGNPAGEVNALRGLADVYEARNDVELALNCMKRITEIRQTYQLIENEKDVERINRYIQLLYR
ncbi:MAG: tetratricopeptide repeat protein [Nitrospiria bacterium]